MSQASVGAVPVSPTAADLFALLWNALSDVLGSATTATLLRRSRNALTERRPEIAGLHIGREGLEYRFQVPATWQESSAESLSLVRELVGELRPLLAELTGAVILRRLNGIQAFKECGIPVIVE